MIEDADRIRNGIHGDRFRERTHLGDGIQAADGRKRADERTGFSGE